MVGQSNVAKKQKTTGDICVGCPWLRVLVAPEKGRAPCWRGATSSEPSKGGRKKGGNIGTPPTPKSRKRRAPNTAAISLTCPEGENADVMLEARTKINQADIGIEA